MPILFQTRERRALIGSFLAALVLMALTVDFVQQSKAQPTASTMFIAPLVQPTPELLTRANSTRKVRIQMVLKGKDLMHTMDVSPNLVGTSWDESARLNKPNTQQLEINMLVNEGSTTDSGSGELFPYPAAFEQPVIVKPSQFPAIIPMTPTASPSQTVLLTWRQMPFSPMQIWQRRYMAKTPPRSMLTKRTAPEKQKAP